MVGLLRNLINAGKHATVWTGIGGGAISPPHSDILQTQTFFLLDKAGGSLCNSSSSAMFWSDGAQISLPLSISYDVIISDNIAASLDAQMIW